MKFRLLRADEIECRIAQCNAYGVGILLYKDARCDMNILDETVGSENWQRHHSRDNANCIVSIWDSKKQMWIEKEDTGTESFTEREKGLASDSFKRACFNWGIGRELYSAPQMFVRKADLETLTESNGKWSCRDFFKVTALAYEGNQISTVIIKNMKNDKELSFSNSKPMTHEVPEDVSNNKISETKVKALRTKMKASGIEEEKILSLYKLDKLEEMTERQFLNCVNNWEKINGI